MLAPKTFDPNAAAAPGSGVFGLPFTPDEARMVLIPVPWEVTTSYGGGTAQGPQAILEASAQVDLFDLDVSNPYEPGIAMLPIPTKIRALNQKLKPLAKRVIAAGGSVQGKKALQAALKQVNKGGEQLNTWVRGEVLKQLEAGKIVGLVGGDHSIPLGAFEAVAAREGDFGILHFDAHSDTRQAYEGFEFSHASIFHNALERIPKIQKLVQVGIRDMCEQEAQFVERQGKRVALFTDRALQESKQSGASWSAIASRIVSELPTRVWISFDIDGLDPAFCPHTGTPVPGGLAFTEAVALIRALVQSGRRIIGFDLNEVAPNLRDRDDEWDANVGARLLYKLCGFTFASLGMCRLQSSSLGPQLPGSRA